MKFLKISYYKSVYFENPFFQSYWRKESISISYQFIAQGMQKKVKDLTDDDIKNVVAQIKGANINLGDLYGHNMDEYEPVKVETINEFEYYSGDLIVLQAFVSRRLTPYFEADVDVLAYFASEIKKIEDKKYLIEKQEVHFDSLESKEKFVNGLQNLMDNYCI